MLDFRKKSASLNKTVKDRLREAIRNCSQKCKRFPKSDQGVFSDCFSSSCMSLFFCSEPEPAILVII